MSKNVGIIQRLFLALPNAVTAGFMLTVWIAPTLFGSESVRNLVPTMVYEFLVIHSTLFYVVLAAQSGMPRFKRIAAYVGLTAFYLIFIIVFSIGFHSTWPLFTFGWLFTSRFISLWTHPDLSNDDNMVAFWLMSVLCFIGGAMAMLLLPIPPLGFTLDFIESLHLPGAGGLVTKPYTEIAWGVFYFGALACFKFFVVVGGSADDNKIYRRDDLDVEHGTFRDGSYGSFDHRASLESRIPVCQSSCPSLTPASSVANAYIVADSRNQLHTPSDPHRRWSNVMGRKHYGDGET